MSETRIFGKVYPNVIVGEGAEIESGSIVKSGEIPPRGYISRGDIVEKAYAYILHNSAYNVTVTQRWICVGCVCSLITEADNLREEDVYVLGGNGAVKWYRRHKNELDKIVEKHIDNRMP